MSIALIVFAILCGIVAIVLSEVKGAAEFVGLVALTWAGIGLVAICVALLLGVTPVFRK